MGRSTRLASTANECLLTESPFSTASRALVDEPLTPDHWQQVYEAQRAFIMQVRMIVVKARAEAQKPPPVDSNSPELRRILGGPAPYRTDHRLCRAPGTRDRVCAEYLGHDGPHNFVLQTQRED